MAAVVKYKKCSRCGKRQLATKFSFSKRRNDYKSECLACGRDRASTRKRDYPDCASRIRLLSALRGYGLSVADYEEMVRVQSNRCAICRDPPHLHARHKRLHIDHDHDTDKVRGLLCASCNTGIGLLKHSPELLRAAISYLTR